jgi:hypothetical protein
LFSLVKNQAFFFSHGSEIKINGMSHGQNKKTKTQRPQTTASHQSNVEPNQSTQRVIDQTAPTMKVKSSMMSVFNG